MSKLLINEPPLQVLPSLAKAVGLNEAIILQQLHYWLQMSQHKHDGRKWIFNTYEEWESQFPFWSNKTIRRIISSLRSAKLILTTAQYNKRGFDNTLWYAIDYEVLSSIQNECACGQLDHTMWSERPDDVVNLTRPIPETTTENTSETTTEIKSISFPAEKAPTPQQEMFGAVCEAIGWDAKTLSKEDKGQVAQAIGILAKANYTVADIRQFMVEIWFKDWRWVDKGQHPTLKNLRQEIGKLRSVVLSVAPQPKAKGMEGYRAMLARQGIDI